MFSCSEDDVTQQKEQQEEQQEDGFCEMNEENPIENFEWINDLVDEDVIDITLHAVKNDIGEDYYVFLNKYIDHELDGETLSFITSIPYDCEGNPTSIWGNYNTDLETIHYGLDDVGMMFGNISSKYEKKAVLYSNYFDFSTPIEEIPWLNAKKNELENLDTNSMIRTINISGYDYYLVNECLECGETKRFKVFNHKGDFAGYFGHNGYIDYEYHDFVLHSLGGFLGEKLYYNIINTSECSEGEYNYHGQYLYYTTDAFGRKYFGCGDIIQGFSGKDGSSFPDWEEEAILIE